MSFWTAKTKEGGNALVEIIDCGDLVPGYDAAGHRIDVYTTKFVVHREATYYNVVDKAIADISLHGPAGFRMVEDDLYLATIGIDPNTLMQAGE